MWRSTEPSETRPPQHDHIVLIPSVGMGHLTPFLRIASMLLSMDSKVTLITPKSIVSAAESKHISFFLSTHPQINHLHFQTVLPTTTDQNPTIKDPFFLQYSAISNSGHLLHPVLASASPFSAVFCDLLLAKSVSQISSDLGFPFYTVLTTSALFSCFMFHLPSLVSDPPKFFNGGESSTPAEEQVVEIPGLKKPLPVSSIPMPFLNPNHLLGKVIVRNIGALQQSKGILLNTFEWFESENLAALNNGKVSSNLPPFLPIGPLRPYVLETDQTQCALWLDKQPPESVVYVSFGSRTPMADDQIREVRDGLEKSGCRFIWVIKTKIVDKEEDEKNDVKELLGDPFLDRTKLRGIVVKGWVNQQEILSHPAIAGFVSHCGWNSVMEAAERGVRVLAWPQHGDQRVNAQVLEKAGLGVWDRGWGLGLGLVKADDIANMISKVVADPNLRRSAIKVGEEATRALDTNCGSSHEAIWGVITKLS